jgi:hypothetical membrane protein
MKSLSNLRAKQNKYTKYGLLLYLSSIQYFIAQIIAAGMFSDHYSLTRNVISDLGNTACGSFGGKYVCSPDHLLMNFSFVLLGITMTSGSYFLIKGSNSKRKAVLLGFDMLAIGGIGTILVGLFPENTVPAFHSFGAMLPFLIGNIGLVITGVVWLKSKILQAYTILSGVLALGSLSLFVFGQYAGVGVGGMERLVAYPQTIWMIVIGIFGLMLPHLFPHEVED